MTNIDGTNGFVVPGLDPQDNSGGSFAVGDVNDDGIDDLLIAATQADPGASNAGEVYVLLGTAAGFAADFDLSTLNGSNGFVLTGAAANDFAGGRMAAGDVNGDGVDDMIIAASSATAGMFFGAGKVFTAFGTNTGFDAVTSLSALDGSNGFNVEGPANNFIAGTSVAAGDVNSDGIDDLVIGANINLSTDTTYILSGRDAGWPATSALWSSSAIVSNTIVGLTVQPPVQQQLGIALAIGDVNDDGVDDLVVGAQGFEGRAFTYAIHGTSSFGTSFNVVDLNGSNGLAYQGSGFGDGNASRLATGDINGDGRDDVIIGAPLFDIDPNSTAGNDGGETYVVYSGDPGSVSSEHGTPLPSTSRLLQNAPNPFVNWTGIGFEMPVAGPVKVEIYNLLGQRVARVVDEWRSAGSHLVHFDGSALPAGMYVYRLETDRRESTKAMTKAW